MTIEEKREKYRAHYYRHHERYKAEAKIRSALKRRRETPEQAAARNAKQREYRAKRAGKLPPMSKNDLALFTLWVALEAAQKRAQRLQRRRIWASERYGYRTPRPPPKEKPAPKLRPPALSREEKYERQLVNRKKWLSNPDTRAKINAYKRALSKKILADAKDDHVKLTALREKRRNASRKWIDKIRSDPEKNTEYKRQQWEKERRRRETNPQRRLSVILRGKVNTAIRRQQNAKKSFNTIELTGCTVPELMKHLESKFEPGMTWKNFGKGRDKWSIDHIRPCASFDLRDPAQQKQCFHFSNTQPMWFSENCSKNSRWNHKKWTHSDHALQPPLTL